MKRFLLSLLSDQMVLQLAFAVVSSKVKNKESQALYKDDLRALRDVLNSMPLDSPK